MNKWILVLLSLASMAKAGSPVWTFTPLTPTSITVPSNGTDEVQYTVTNQSRKMHTLIMNAIGGVSQDVSAGNCQNPFTLGYQ